MQRLIVSLFKYIFFIFCLNSLVSCYSNRIDQIEENLFSVQTRILSLDENINKGLNKIKSSDRNYRTQQANSDIEQEKYKIVLQEIKGDIDILRQGVLEGKLPDQKEGTHSIDNSDRKFSKDLMGIPQT